MVNIIEVHGYSNLLQVLYSTNTNGVSCIHSKTPLLNKIRSKGTCIPVLYNPCHLEH
uniref:Uncharacterized protein n=1 Tax=Anguilla anguilla TaxID=7936 RepID=A0A0E9WU74_ANGAN